MKEFLGIAQQIKRSAAISLIYVLVTAEVFAAEIVSPAMNCISADRASNSTLPSFTILEPIIIKEKAKQDFQAAGSRYQTLVLSPSTGWTFKPGTGRVRAFGKDLASVKLIVSTNFIEIKMRISGSVSTDHIRLEGIEVQALDGREVHATGFIFRSHENPGTAKIKGLEPQVDFLPVFCSLVQQPGIARQLAFENRPATAISGELLPEQPVVVSLDQFGTPTIEGLGPVEMVKLRLSAGSGMLDGERTLNIGTAGGNGRIRFHDLRISQAGEKRLIASSAQLIFAITNEFTVSEEEETTNFFADDPDLVCKL